MLLMVQGRGTHTQPAPWLSFLRRNVSRQGYGRLPKSGTPIRDPKLIGFPYHQDPNKVPLTTTICVRAPRKNKIHYPYIRKNMFTLALLFLWGGGGGVVLKQLVDFRKPPYELGAC